MRAKLAMKILNVTRITLYNYIKSGKIKATQLPNGYYDFDEQSIYRFLNKSQRVSYIYARVSTKKQQPDLKNQIKTIKSFCSDNDFSYHSILSDVSSGLDFDRDNFSFLFDEIINNRVDCVFITYKDRLTRHSFSMLESVFEKFGTKIIVVHNSEHKDSHQELFDDIVTLMHSYSTKVYSRRSKSLK